jgi:two-component system phosphate regulon sensor histidine kinase PhoR
VYYGPVDHDRRGSSATLRRVLALPGMQKEFHELSLRSRVVLSQLPMAVVTVFVAVLALFLDPSLFTRPVFLSAHLLQWVLLAACALVPWDRLPYGSFWVIPLLDFGVVGLLRQSSSSSLGALGVLAVLPVIWLTVSGVAPRVAGLLSFAAPLLILWAPVLIAGPRTKEALLAPLLFPLVLFGLWAPLNTILQSMQLQQRELRVKDAALLASLAESQRKEAMLNALTDAVDVGLVAVDENGHDVLMNRKQKVIHKIASPAQLPDPNESQLELFSTDGQTPIPTEERPVRRAIAGESYSEYVIRAGRGRESRAYSVSARRMRTPEGERIGAVVAFNDVTELHAALNAKDDFVAGVSHELRTPLTSILGYLELALDDEAELPDHTVAYLQVAQRNSERLLALVGDLLSTASGQIAVAPTRTNLVEVIRASLSSAAPRAEAAGVELHDELPDQCEAFVDAQRMGQVVDNLLSNAVKYSPDGGTVTVRTVSSRTHTGFEVADTGMGMTEEERAEVFTKFFRAGSARKAAIPGVGLGLAISRSIVESHGGTITVCSSPGVGTVFAVLLPREPAEAS